METSRCLKQTKTGSLSRFCRLLSCVSCTVEEFDLMSKRGSSHIRQVVHHDSELGLLTSSMIAMEIDCREMMVHTKPPDAFKKCSLDWTWEEMELHLRYIDLTLAYGQKFE
jgi:hypothetical protein